jgi:sugar/nucleoside kinase (ribokinase family)
VAKRGAAGAGWCAGPRRGRGAAHHAEVLDTTGAGDAFAAGWIAAAVGGAGPDEALERALAAGARAVAQIGARPVPLGGSR